MTDGGFYAAKRASPASLTIVILLHGAAITGLALSKTTFSPPDKPLRTEIRFVPIEPPPPSEPIPNPADPRQRAPSQVTVRDPIVRLPTDRTDFTATPTVDPPRPRDLPGPTVVPEPAEPVTPPRPDPVRIEAQMDALSRLQPPYPASEERAGAEGSVAIRVVIGPDGRVRSTAKVRATSDAFYQATERHALRNWRFKPATVDGRPVESRRVVHVKFQLDGEG